MKVQDLIAELQRFDLHDDVKVECKWNESDRHCKECGSHTTVHTEIDSEPNRVVRHDCAVYIQL